MANVLIDETVLQGWANTVREKTGATDKMKPSVLLEQTQVNWGSGGGGGDDTLKKLIERTVADFTFPEGITKIGNYAFDYCENLRITSLPTSLQTIGMCAFERCSNLNITSIPASVTSIGNYAFNMCKGITTLTFEGTPNAVVAGAFNQCTNLTTINVPWAEGAVANAPWGATNATINYNYTEG